MGAPRPPREVLAVALHDKACPDRRCEPTVMGKYFDQADELLTALKGEGWSLWRKFTDEEEEANIW